VSFLGDVLDGLGLDRPAFVANSLGSLWTAWFAMDRPGRVAALAHVGCPALALDTSAPLPMRLLSARPLGRLMMRLQPPSPRQVRQLAKMVREHPLPPEIADLLLTTEQLPGFEPTFLATLHTLVRLRGARPEMALTADQLAQIDQPSLLVFGRDDPMGAEPVGRRLATALPDAALHIVDGGHAPWIHHADQIAPVVTTFLHRILAGHSNAP
jgi:pimeloyl-ACP methyl ester carboxylesterase